MDKFLVEVSARHIHLNREDMDILFGAGSELHVKKTLSQPGQFASEEQVILKGPKGEMKLRVLGPLRNETQIEVSLTEARQLGVKALIRESGMLDGTEGGLTMVGPAGEKAIDRGVIAAKRHIHMTPEDAQEFGIEDKAIVSVRINTPGRSLIFGDVVVRVSEKFALAMHIDTDESNAACAVNGTMGELIK